MSWGLVQAAYLPIVVVLVQSYHQHASGSSPLACQWQLSISMLVAILDKCYHQHASGSSPLACQWELSISMLVAMLDQCYHQHASGSSPLACQWQATTSMNFCTFKKNCATLNNFACGPLSAILQPAIKWDNVTRNTKCLGKYKLKEIALYIIIEYQILMIFK